MTDHHSESLAGRVERLERECRRLRQIDSRWKKIAVAVFAGSIALLIAGAQAGKVIEAERLVLRKDGHVRAALELDKGGSPRLVIFDEEGHEGVVLDLDRQTGSNLVLRSKQEASSVEIGAGNHGASQVLLFSEGGRSISLVTSGGDDSSAELSLGKNLGPGRIWLMENDLGASLQFNPLEKQVQQTLVIGSDGNGAMEFGVAAKVGKNPIVLGAGDDGAPVFKVQGKQGNVLLEVPKP